MSNVKYEHPNMNWIGFEFNTGDLLDWLRFGTLTQTVRVIKRDIPEKWVISPLDDITNPFTELVSSIELFDVWTKQKDREIHEMINSAGLPVPNVRYNGKHTKWNGFVFDPSDIEYANVFVSSGHSYIVIEQNAYGDWVVRPIIGNNEYYVNVLTEDELINIWAKQAQRQLSGYMNASENRNE